MAADRDVKAYAEARHHSNRFSSKNTPLEPRSEELGIVGSLAFARLVGRPDWKPPTKHPKGKEQITLTVNGYKIKTTTSLRGALNVKASRDLTGDIYVLMWCVSTPPAAEGCFCAGWAWRDEVLAMPVTVPEGMSYKEPMHVLGPFNRHRAVDLWPVLGMRHVIDPVAMRLAATHGPASSGQHARRLNDGRRLFDE